MWNGVEQSRPSLNRVSWTGVAVLLLRLVAGSGAQHGDIMPHHTFAAARPASHRRLMRVSRLRPARCVTWTYPRDALSARRRPRVTGHVTRVTALTGVTAVSGVRPLPAHIGSAAVTPVSHPQSGGPRHTPCPRHATPVTQVGHVTLRLDVTFPFANAARICWDREKR